MVGGGAHLGMVNINLTLWQISRSCLICAMVINVLFLVTPRIYKQARYQAGVVELVLEDGSVRVVYQ